MRGPDERGTARARTLRRVQTDAEQALWSRLRDRRLAESKFVRQLPIGRYFADFDCREAKLIVEVDGSQHAESAYDRERDTWLASQGWRVLRFWNGEIARNMNGVLETILASITERRPSSSLRSQQGDTV
ncbi:endonuclease domain-containing protein [Methylobacterium nonmethylotrophicum]|uniref:endonuclease domain-containing protein n=1 Tax=Methylobacterium nonmethylotrophicum TaxID=1141884 RepID=UPI001FDEE931|nr:endonuclease domain-containing protein [Methylobacterium nonmethylotrophicum]